MRLICYILLAIAVKTSYSQEIKINGKTFQTKNENPITVLNIGTFHMGHSSDASVVDFDPKLEDNVKEVHRIARSITKFNPTIIVVEKLPENNQKLQTAYRNYVNDSTLRFEKPSEVELLAFEVGRLSEAAHIYGINSLMEYDYSIASKIQSSNSDMPMYLSYMQTAGKANALFESNNPTIQERLRFANNKQVQDFLININADLLTHIGTIGNYEGADEASKFYQRNLRMYSNLNQIPMSKDDRILILMGATHTAFFNNWLDRSPKYLSVDVANYLDF